MRRRHVPNFEWGLVFKVVIMMGILFSRLGSGASSYTDESEEVQGIPAKFYILGTVLVGGFLFQTGYAQFLYTFVVEENILYRILILAFLSCWWQWSVVCLLLRLVSLGAVVMVTINRVTKRRHARKQKNELQVAAVRENRVSRN